MALRPHWGTVAIHSHLGSGERQPKQRCLSSPQATTRNLGFSGRSPLKPEITDGKSGLHNSATFVVTAWLSG